jgi:hypothetical protein
VVPSLRSSDKAIVYAHSFILLDVSCNIRTRASAFTRLAFVGCRSTKFSCRIHNNVFSTLLRWNKLSPFMVSIFCREVSISGGWLFSIWIQFWPEWVGICVWEERKETRAPDKKCSIYRLSINILPEHSPLHSYWHIDFLKFRVTSSPGSLRRHFFLFTSKTVSQRRRPAQALLTLALSSYSGCSVTFLLSLLVNNYICYAKVVDSI